MPRYPKRKNDALELLATLKRGPVSIAEGDCTPEKYKLWLETWITPKVKELIPELAQLRKEGKLK